MENPKGKHLLLDLYQCGNSKILNDKDQIDQILTECVKLSGSTIEGKLFKEFQPSGISAVFLLSESHISVHLWPQQRYLSMDLYTCGEKCDPLGVLDYIERIFTPEVMIANLQERGNHNV